MSTLAHEHVSTEGTLAHEHINTQRTLACEHEREHVNTEGTLAGEHVNTQGTLAREHVFSKHDMQFSRLLKKNEKICCITNKVKTTKNEWEIDYSDIH